ncbi:DEAD/DEAH box helicase [Jeotgalibacillus proteolyticus]|uniref:DEAD-box ATP-dependent RNA helicase CshB n=1 Tax=Jeotgalibacillus proteolyticus TaxID=2082395 RepID=A0A2S5GEY1_9BACL|nr:DEAD/DEAH box helicase [Jeotgalibacillus proteolyticus]PPA71433.1 DEAD/DEAH box helicase [Jeotgalibacillus proteolyticus]
MSQAFKRYEFTSYISEAIQALGFHEPTPIQEKMIPMIKKGQSAIGQSQTGTGKTHAYLLPLLNQVDLSKQEVQLVITAPTRELAKQIHHEVGKITAHFPTPLLSKCFVGGTDKQRTIEKLKSQPQIVVGTPGRINDLIKEQALFVHTASSIVIDEADLMLEMGFIEDVDQIASRMPENLQILVFSATIPEKLKPFLKKYMENPQYAHIEPKQVQAENIEFILVPKKSGSKIEVLYDVLTSFNPFLAIVFTNTKVKADEVADALLSKGLKVGRVHGGLAARERTRMMKQIRDLEYQYIVATDLAARGIDIPGVSHVINFELPTDLDFFVHRVGRTARAGHSGTAITLYEPTDEDALNQVEKKGISFKHMEVRNGEWVELTDRHKRSNRKKAENEIDVKAKSLVRKPKKVKPGYKKKMQYKMDQIKKRERRVTRRKKD